MTDTVASEIPWGTRIKRILSRDDIIMRASMVIIALYLVVTLILPLYVMLSKAFSTYTFNLSKYEVQVSDKDGKFSGSPVNLAELNKKTGVYAPNDLATSSDGRLAITKLFPGFSFRSPVHYRIRGTTEDAAYLVGAALKKGTGGRSLIPTPSAEWFCARTKNAVWITSRHIFPHPRFSSQSRTRSSSPS